MPIKKSNSLIEGILFGIYLYYYINIKKLKNIVCIDLGK